MEWALVLVMWNAGETESINLLETDSMYDCFDAREEIVERLGEPPRFYQAVCLHNREPDNVD